MSDDEERVLAELEAQFEGDPSFPVDLLDRPWVRTAGWLAIVVGLVAMVALLTTSVWLSFAGVILAGVGLIVVGQTFTGFAPRRWRHIAPRAPENGHAGDGDN